MSSGGGAGNVERQGGGYRQAGVDEIIAGARRCDAKAAELELTAMILRGHAERLRERAATHSHADGEPAGRWRAQVG